MHDLELQKIRIGGPHFIYNLDSQPCWGMGHGLLAAPAGSGTPGTQHPFPLPGCSCICLTCLAPLTMKTIANACKTYYIPGPIPLSSAPVLRERRCYCPLPSQGRADTAKSLSKAVPPVRGRAGSGALGEQSGFPAVLRGTP